MLLYSYIYFIENMRRREGKTTWEDFEKRVGLKRTGGGKDEKRQMGNCPSDILVQRMSSTPSGKLNKYEPLDTRDFVPFGDYDELSMENIKDACEQFYKASPGSCDILASDRGPSCNKIEQIKGKKVYFIRFLQPTLGKDDTGVESVGCKARSTPAISPRKKVQSYSHCPANVKTTPTIYPKSLSIRNLMKAGKLVSPPKTSVLRLEYFDVQKCCWSANCASITLAIEERKFANGGFRDAFLARSVTISDFSGTVTIY